MTSRQPVIRLGLSHHNSDLQSNNGITCLCLTFLSTSMLAPVRVASLQGCRLAREFCRRSATASVCQAL